MAENFNHLRRCSLRDLKKVIERVKVLFPPGVVVYVYSGVAYLSGLSPVSEGSVLSVSARTHQFISMSDKCSVDFTISALFGDVTLDVDIDSVFLELADVTRYAQNRGQSHLADLKLKVAMMEACLSRLKCGEAQ